MSIYHIMIFPILKNICHNANITIFLEIFSFFISIADIIITHIVIIAIVKENNEISENRKNEKIMVHMLDILEYGINADILSFLKILLVDTLQKAYKTTVIPVKSHKKVFWKIPDK